MGATEAEPPSVASRIVYDGPPFSGKSTTLRAVAARVDTGGESRGLTFRTETDRLLLQEFAPFGVAGLGATQIRLQAVTIPGDVHHLLTRRYALLGAGAVIFVADSRPSRLEASVTALGELHRLLGENGADIDAIPLVFQYNRQDAADALSLDELQRALNPDGRPAFASSAIEATGVLTPFLEAVRQAVDRLVAGGRLTAGRGNTGSLCARHLAGLAGGDA